MRFFFSENNRDYTSYTFNYAIYCIMEAQSELPIIYNRGFLPYSNNLKVTADIFYLARSLRIDLDRFKDTSENRRIQRKIDPLAIKMEVQGKSNFAIDNPVFLSFCLEYAANRFSGNAMTEERLKYVLSKETGSHILSFSSNGEIMGYVLAAIEGNTMQYWFAFFNQEYMKSYPLGKWAMWQSIQWAKNNGLSHVYLGTCYGKHSLYKVRDFKGVAFFDGSKWNSDTKLLKELCKTDNEIIDKDRFKLLEDPNVFINDLRR